MIPKNLKNDYNPSRNDAFNGPFSGGSSGINTQLNSKFSPAAKIKVMGCGGGGGNIVRRMIEMGVEGVEFWAMNTDLQALKSIHADGIIQLGASITRGLGAGMAPEIGEQSAREAEAEIEAALTGADMVFITAGMGGGTGTGATPVVAEIAKRLGILTIGVITKPFDFEGGKRRQLAEEGIEKLKQSADAVIIVPNQKLLQIVDKRTSVYEAFRISDDVLRQAVQGISDLINLPGEINVDFADVRSVMSNAGTALMGMGRANGAGDGAAVTAALQAIESPLIELSIEGAKGVLINVQGGKNLTLFDVNEAAEAIQKIVDPEAKIIFGFSTDNNMQDEVRVTVIATGFTHEKTSNQADGVLRGFGANSNPGGTGYGDFDPYKTYNSRAGNNLGSANNFTNSSSSSNRTVGGGSLGGSNRDSQIERYGNFNSAPSSNNSNQQNNSRVINNDNNENTDGDLEIPTFLRNKLRRNNNDF
jgi:cell division protein FtsZ